jgi:hypothetical protein
MKITIILIIKINRVIIRLIGCIISDREENIIIYNKMSMIINQ